MNKEDYSEIIKACNNIHLPENWYIVFPEPEKLKNFDAINCRTVFFVVTDVNMYDKEYLKSFKMIENLHIVYDRLSHLPYFKKNIDIVDFQVTNSHNRYLKNKVHSFTIHYIDRVSSALVTLNT